MLCLFDRSPSDEGKDKLKKLIISQPPHQQCFTFCNESLELEKLTVDVMKVYSKAGPLDQMEKFPFTQDKEFNNPPPKCKVYDWSSRTIDVLGLSTLITDTLKHDPNPDLYKGSANAALIGIQLNDPIYQLTFIADSSSSSPNKGVFTIPDFSQADADFVAKLKNPMFDGSCSTVGITFGPYRQRLVYDKNGTDIVFNLKRKKSWDSTLEITCVKLTIPLDLFEAPPSVHNARMLINVRLLPVIEVDERNVIVKLIPKTENRRTQLNDNDNLSFIIVGAQLNTKATNISINVTESYYEHEDIGSVIRTTVIVPR